MDSRLRKYTNLNIEREFRHQPTFSIILQLFMLTASALLTIAAFALIYYSSIPEFEEGPLQISVLGLKIKENETGFYNLTSLKRRSKREIRLKEEVNQVLKNLMVDPRCKEGCEKLQKKLNSLTEGIESSILQLKKLKNEISDMASSCKTSHEVVEVKDNDSNEVQLKMKSQGDELLEDSFPKADKIFPLDQDIAGSNHYQFGKYVEGIPPTGPDGSAAGSGPGEVVQTSQQMDVSLPQQVQRICSLVPGPSGSTGYVCTPTHNILSPNVGSNENFYLQVLNGARLNEVHIPTAISTPNPFAFPTLSGNPVIAPVSAAAPNQFLPVFNPMTGRVSFQNYQQGSANIRPNFTFVNQQQVPFQGQQLMMPHYLDGGLEFFIPQPQPTYKFQQQLVPQQQQFMVPQPQFIPQSNQMALMPLVLPTQYQQQPHHVPAVAAPSMVVPAIYQPQASPQVYIPQPPAAPPNIGVPELHKQMLQCSYVVVPNSPVQTYQFPTVTGVAETIRRSDKPKEQALATGKNDTAVRSTSYGNCAEGTRPCEDQLKCISEQNWCDSNTDCLDISDELSCTCKDRIGHEKLCDGYFDCPDGEDELDCFGCSSGSFSCKEADATGGKAICLPLQYRCNGIHDCSSGIDEMECSLITEEQLHSNQISAISYSKGFLYRNWKGTWYHVCNSTSWQMEACSAELGHLKNSPRESYVPLREHTNLLINQKNLEIEMVTICNVAKGMALWIECPMPECGMKPSSFQFPRTKRAADIHSPPQYWLYPPLGEEEPIFQSVPEVHDFVKSFFNSMSIFDKKKYYKRIWGPLVQPYLGVKVQDDKGKEEKKRLPIKKDPTQDSWKYYMNIHSQASHHSGHEEIHKKLSDNTKYKTQPNNHPLNYDNEYPNNNGALQYFYPIYTETIYHPSHEIPNQLDKTNYEDFDYDYHQTANIYPNYQMPDFFGEYYEGNRTKREEEARVVGGRISEPGSWPWLVVIYKDGDFHCGGTILKPNVILTAAHCTDNFQNHYYEVRAGLLRRMSYSPQQQIRKVAEIIVHEDFNRADLRNDIALLKLSSELKWNRWVMPACLPPQDKELPPPNIVCTAIGWGAIFEHGPDPDYLKEVNVPIWAYCKHAVDRLGNEICAGYPEGGRDTCQGDSGGPLLCRSLENKWYVAGIVSHGDGCGQKGEPGVYTRVSMFYDWILQNLGWPKSVSKSIHNECPGLLCKTGECISQGLRCNKHIDCLDGKDEEGCELILTANIPRMQGGGNVTGTHSNRAGIPSENYTTTVADKTIESSSVTFVDEGLETTTEDPNSLIEEDQLHSQQLMPLDLTRLYSCKQLDQRILASRFCDNIVDCEDGSDENECNCSDKLKHFSPNLICDGKIDCLDGSDEKHCPAKCPNNQFYCNDTDLCIPIEKRCDEKNDCMYGEDEKDCYALIDDKLTMDYTGRPPLLLNGTAVSFVNGSWKSICNENNPSSRAIMICRSLGFRITVRNKEVEVLKYPASEDETLCKGLMVSCMSPESRLWTAPLFIEGMPVAIAALISPDWLLAPLSSISFNDSKVHLNCWLGKSDFNLNILGPYDQYIRVDGMVNNVELHTTLLHLEHSANITRATAPLSFPNWPTAVDGTENCEGILMDSKGSIISVKLMPIICSHNKRCYSWDRNDKICELNGLVVCHSSYGSYITSVISEDICKQTLITLPDITHNKLNFIKYLDKTADYTFELEEDICDTLRCENGKCLDWMKIGDGVSDCFDSRDESDEVWERKEEYCRVHDIHCTCKPGYIRCHSGECISAQMFCDGNDNCEDASDEEDCSCAGYISLARPQMLCDGNQNCKDKSDEDWDYCANITNCLDKKKFQCPSIDVCIPKDFLCDGDSDCPDSKDEEMCIAIRSPVDKQDEGLVFSLLFGQLVPQCLEPDDDSLGQIICSMRGLKLDLATYSKIPRISVLMDAFSIINLNSNTSISLRVNRPFADIVESKNETCTGMYVHCI